jgi:hypothetical protein
MFRNCRTVLTQIGRQWRNAAHALACLVFVLSSCERPKPAPAPAAAPTEAAPVIGPDGAAGVSTSLPMNVESVGGAARGYDVAEAQGQVDGERFTKITLSRNREIIFEILPTPDRRVHAIVTRSPQARGPAGEIVGRSSFGEAPFVEVVYCRSAQMHEDFSFTCSNAQDGRFWRAYRLDRAYRGRVEPFTAISPDAAVAAILVQMTWVAPR